MSEVFTIFYAWQSDTPAQHARRLIRDALDAAADAISKDESVPYCVLVQSDTENEPGLCNIPETILRRLRESDAVVFDLTFVAATDGETPKRCSNPNVLFELGYAFAELGPERLICVMNEAHGPTASQIFDLAHHRRPIPYRSPADRKKRSDTVRSLATSLESALREVISKVGLTGGYGGDDEIMHQRDLSEIQSYWQSVGRPDPESPSVTIWFRPKLYRPKRWPDVETIEAMLRTIGPHTDRFGRFPPQPTGNAPMDWGLYNDTYGDPWTLTYAGQFWTNIEVGGHQPLKLSPRDISVSPERPAIDTLDAGQWVNADLALANICTVFQLARNLSAELLETEIIQLGFEAADIRGRWLHFPQWDSMGPCKAPRIRRNVEMTAGEIREQWLDQFADIGKAFCDLFCRDGRVLSRDDVKGF